MRIIILLLLALIPLSVQSQTIVVPPSGNLQSALTNATCGSTIVLTASKDGGVYKAPADFVAYELRKSCPASSPITITSSVAPPANGVRVGPADRPNMPKLIARVGSPGFFDIKGKSNTILVPASSYRLRYLWFTNEKRADQSGTSYLIGGGGSGQVADHASNIEVDQCFFNPVDWDENNQNLRSSVNYASQVSGVNITLKNSYMTGFGAKYANSDVILDGGCILMGTAPGPYTMDNNHCEAWFVGFFVGGGDPGTANRATVSASTATSITLSQTANLQPGDYISYRVPQDHPDNPGRRPWGASIVDSINGLTITLKIPTQVTGTNDNKRTGPPALVGTGSEVRWRGWIPSDIRITRNFFYKPPRWYDYVGSDGKGFFEIKLCDRCLIDGNTFDGNTGFTITVRNQGGAAAWSVIKNLTMSNNLVTRFGAVFATLFYDNQQLSMPSSNIEFSNNLIYGDTGPDPNFGIRPKIFVGQHGNNIRVFHNTVIQTGEIMRSGSGTSNPSSEQMTNFVWRDNITMWGTGEQHGYACLNSSTANNEVCTPGYIWTRNAMIGAPTGPLADRRSMASFPPGNFNPATIVDVRFADAANGNYELLPTSPLKGKGTNGKDPGVDMAQLRAHLSGGSTAPLPSPSATPIVSPTPVASPSPTPVASPSPTPVATPQPSPVPTPTPTNTISIQGRVIDQNDRSVAGALVSAFNRTVLSRAGDGYFSFSGIPLGTTITATKEGYTFSTETVRAGVPEQNYFIRGRVVVGPTPSPSPSVPLPSPSPSPTVLPTPSPSPTVPPQPTPTPTPVSNIEVITEPWPSDEGQQDAAWKRLHEAGWKCTPNVPSPAGNKIRCWRLKM